MGKKKQAKTDEAEKHRRRLQSLSDKTNPETSKRTESKPLPILDGAKDQQDAHKSKGKENKKITGEGQEQQVRLGINNTDAKKEKSKQPLKPNAEEQQKPKFERGQKENGNRAQWPMRTTVGREQQKNDTDAKKENLKELLKSNEEQQQQKPKFKKGKKEKGNRAQWPVKATGEGQQQQNDTGAKKENLKELLKSNEEQQQQKPKLKKGKKEKGNRAQWPMRATGEGQKQQNDTEAKKENLKELLKSNEEQQQQKPKFKKGKKEKRNKNSVHGTMRSTIGGGQQQQNGTDAINQNLKVPFKLNAKEQLRQQKFLSKMSKEGMGKKKTSHRPKKATEEGQVRLVKNNTDAKKQQQKPNYNGVNEKSAEPQQVKSGGAIKISTKQSSREVLPNEATKPLQQQQRIKQVNSNKCKAPVAKAQTVRKEKTKPFMEVHIYEDNFNPQHHYYYEYAAYDECDEYEDYDEYGDYDEYDDSEYDDSFEGSEEESYSDDCEEEEDSCENDDSFEGSEEEDDCEEEFDCEEEEDSSENDDSFEGSEEDEYYYFEEADYEGEAYCWEY